MGCIYSIENTVNGKKYIGQSVDGKRRINRHSSSLRNQQHYNQHLQSSWNKYGESAFIFKILVDNLPEHYMDDVERGLIATFKTMDKRYGYNRESGGHINKKMSPEAIDKNRQAKLGKPSWNKGKNHAAETKEKLSIGMLEFYANGGMHPMQGKKHSLEAIEKNRQANLGKSNSPSTEFKKGHISLRRRPLTDQEGTIWPSIASFCVVNGVSQSYISRQLKNNKSYKGIYLRYYEEPIKEEAKIG